MLKTNISVDHAISGGRVLLVFGVPHALVQSVAYPVLVLVSYSLIALGSFACQHEVAPTCQLVGAALASNQEVEVDE